MREGTVNVLDCLRRQRQLKVDAKLIEQLARDVTDLGVDKFVSQAVDYLRPASKVTRAKKTQSPMQSRFQQYQKKSGLRMNQFIGVLHSKAEASGLVPEGAGAEKMRSGPKYFAFLSEHLTSKQIEELLGEVLSDHF